MDLFPLEQWDSFILVVMYAEMPVLWHVTLEKHVNIKILLLSLM